MAVSAGTGLHAAEGPSRIAPRPLAWAFGAMAEGDWGRAKQIAQRDGPLAEEIVEWARLRAGQGDATDVLIFLAAHPDWPGLPLLRKQSEPAFAGASGAQVLAFFGAEPPRTPEGALIYARGLAAAGQSEAAKAEAIRAWVGMPMPEALEAEYVKAFGPDLATQDAVRAEEMFWQGETEAQRRMAARLSGDAATLSEARRLARSGVAEAQEKIDALPRALRGDAALAYARFRAAVGSDRDDDAREIMLTQSEIPGGLGRPDLWANERRIWARQALRDGDADLAYRLAAHHQITEGGNFADLEWLAGYIALTAMKDPDTALAHFRTLSEGVQTPISLGRAWYWIGRAHEAAGRKEEARRAYLAGAEQQTTFYGLLAAEKAGVPFDMRLAGTDAPAEWRGSAVEGAELRQAAMLLVASGQPATGEMFLMHYAASLREPELRQLAAMLEDRGDAHLAVRLGKLAAEENVILPRAYYALHPMREMSLPVPMEMALAIARRESEFDPTVRSHAGASGLMQLMPGTAEHVAKGLGVEHAQDWLTSDWRHNAVLGSAYLAELSEEFRGNVVLMSVGYNAGPHRSRDWIARFGDPRDKGVDVVDWIEGIPFRETRNYVQRVAESLPVYRARLGLEPLPVPFTEELKGSTLLPLAPDGE